MPTALISQSGREGEPPLAQDLAAVGVAVVAEVEATSLLQDTIRLTPDLIVWFESHPADDLFAATSAVEASAPRPVILFTDDPDARLIERATQSGVHSYVVNGYSRQRLRSVIKVAQARFRHIQLLRDELGDVNRRFEERKLVDRAKGILMGARQIREDEAFRILRTRSMRQKRRIGQVAQQVIESARYGEAVNLAGQLRMLSQRIVKHYALGCADPPPGEAAAILDDSRRTVASNLQVLSRQISQETFGDLFDGVRDAWAALDRALDGPPVVSRLARIDQLAETLLDRAETLTSNLELAGIGSILHVINVCGRQRMLSQRLAKDAVLALLLSGEPALAATRSRQLTEQVFSDAFAYLKSLPLSTEGIRAELAGADTAWASFRRVLSGPMEAGDRVDLSVTSEVVLGHFDRLTEHYERSIQTILD